MPGESYLECHHWTGIWPHETLGLLNIFSAHGENLQFKINNQTNVENFGSQLVVKQLSIIVNITCLVSLHLFVEPIRPQKFNYGAKEMIKAMRIL